MLRLTGPLTLALFVSAAPCVLADAPPLPFQPTLDAAAPVAQVDGKPIPYSEVTHSAHDQLAQLDRDYARDYARVTLTAARDRAARLETTVNELVDNRVLELEAAKQKTTPEALLAGVKSTTAVSESDERAFYEQERAQLNQPFEQMADKIKQFLQRQATEVAQFDYLESLRAKYKAKIDWEPMRETVEAIGPQRGPSTAKVTIIEFSDFQCPFCRRLAPILKEVAKLYPDQVRVVFRNMPLRTMHPDAGKAAEAGVCAARQGKFWELHDLMYAEQGSLSVDALKEKAHRLGLDSKAFDQCLDSGDALKAVQVDEDASERLGLTSTPSSFVNGRFVNGSLPLYRWRGIIDEELQRTPVPHP